MSATHYWVTELVLLHDSNEKGTAPCVLLLHQL